jgi:spermidine/putrescine ABC transporter ATP-binding subunit
MIDVELIQLTKKFKDIVAVDDVSLEIEQGEFFFLLGPSGCGKTTTLRIIGGLEDPNGGVVKIKGENVTAKPPEARDTATVFQSWALFPHKTIFDNLAFGLKMRKKPKNEINEKVHQYLELVNLAGFGDRFPAQLSGGQKQRVALARALVVEPAVLLLDEPLSALDLKLRQQMRFEIKRIQKSINITTIFVTHDQTEALAMADRIVVMNEGKVVQIGSPHDIYYHPNSKFTSEFIGETNFLEGIVQHSEKQNVIVNLSPEATLKAFSTTNEIHSGKVLVGVRPEHIRLKREQPQTTNNVLEGRLIDMTFMGATLRFHIEFGDKIIAVDSVGSPERTAKYNASEKVFLEIEPQNCLVLPT